MKGTIGWAVRGGGRQGAGSGPPCTQTLGGERGQGAARMLCAWEAPAHARVGRKLAGARGGSQGRWRWGFGGCVCLGPRACRILSFKGWPMALLAPSCPAGRELRVPAGSGRGRIHSKELWPALLCAVTGLICMQPLVCITPGLTYVPSGGLRCCATEWVPAAGMGSIS